ncbi:3-deoxy-7-phosphoheptulonate synthase [Streptomyces sp. NPDC093089]|uniref:3-deoxy-7-phosphoheptulonate synthase n=1 Tax=Streptomyces sp. NPDC093089 TaxID=3366024 RepID=UPI003810DEF8
MPAHRRSSSSVRESAARLRAGAHRDGPHPEAGHDVPYATTGHLLRPAEPHEPGGDHARRLSSVHNPVAVRLGPGTSSDTALAHVDRLDPHRAPGRLALVTAMGADRVRDLLPEAVEKVRAGGASAC